MIATQTETQYKFTIVHSPGMPPSKIKDKPYEWQEVEDIVAANKLEKFARSLQQTENYHQFKRQLQKTHTTVFKHLLINELRWYDAKANGGMSWDDVVRESVPDESIVINPGSYKLFMNAADVKIVPNHFPYYFQADVVHLCVWSKLRIEPDASSEKGDISPKTREIIEKYVVKTFVHGLGMDRSDLVWFKNWEALQSVKSISHLHVLARGISHEQLQKVLYLAGNILTDDDF